ncbi:RanGTP-binding protein-domain-containing protein [Copromyces sp. CBS 386.78]|nr:RanGTP-binding protein-domain-containing protein [Copromyces sp. CBS 386.78]
MDALLAKLGSHAVNYAIRSGIAITSTYAVNQCSRLLKTVDDKGVYTELKKLQKLLDSKIKIVSPAIDLIEFKSGRGNVFLEAAVPLAKSLHRDIIALGKRLNDAATAEESSRSDGKKARMSEAHHFELLTIMKEMKELLARIDREIPLIQLAITASGERMNTTVNAGISPSRLMQASAFLSFGDSHFVNNPNRAVPIGPSFTLSLYMLFRGHSRLSGASSAPATPSTGGRTWTKEQPYGVGEGERKPIWQEVVHKARVRLVRAPLGWKFDKIRGYCPGESSDGAVNGYSAAVDSALSMLGRPDEYAYHLEMIEDLDDGRVHEDDDARGPFDGVDMAGIRDSIPIHQVSKIFYTDTGRLLNIGNAEEGDNNPVLLLKRDLHAPDPIELKRQWYTDPEEQAEGSEGETAYDTAEDDEQAILDAQLLAETKSTELAAAAEEGRLRKALGLPSHLDPEWLALEVFVESEDESDDDDEGDDKSSIRSSKSATPRDKVVDSKLIDQIRNVSLQPYPNTPPNQRKYVPSPLSSTSSLPTGGANGKQLFQTPTQVQGAQKEPNSMDSFVARSPFGAITSSLSLMEMLIRLCSLQEFQQTSHLSIPDHILTFFLEETSTTGLRGEAKWDVRHEAKMRMGFDPYTDTPTKST